tara:strand:+ start:75 stop:740 length:666 start_codon:yes stop_codon:yes gene_type:complete
VLVFDNIKASYLPYCKCATSTVFNFLSELVYSNDEIASLPYNQIRENMHDLFEGPSNHPTKSHFVFTIVRNPWSRLVSAHKEIMKISPWGNIKIPDRWTHSMSFNEIHSIINGSTRFDDFVDFVINIEPEAKKDKESVAFYRRYLDIGYPINRYDFVGKTETLLQDLHYIYDNLHTDISMPQILHLNKSSPYNYREYYTDKLASLVGEYYLKDIEVFDYEF